MNATIALISESLDRYIHTHLGENWFLAGSSVDLLDVSTSGDYKSYVPCMTYVTLQHIDGVKVEGRAHNFALALQKAVDLVEEQYTRMGGQRAREDVRTRPADF